ncbi:hypothetical protein KIN20_015842 [Parelaphostrongylus tenuis]|uniref:Uncharacterized protein n=1 Tax=Parelaphostrongylus tenuis TaxID=148309 RepID=A0AAD5QPB5_PARTN|nr:hypothetical protein KIN20_015842 [Parelaphostrongylus tenuis]
MLLSDGGRIAPFRIELRLIVVANAIRTSEQLLKCLPAIPVRPFQSTSNDDDESPKVRENHSRGSEADSPSKQRRAEEKGSASYTNSYRNVKFPPKNSNHSHLERNTSGSEMPRQQDSRLSLLRPGSSEMSIIYNSEGFPVRIIRNNQVIHTMPSEALSMQALGSPDSEHLREGFPLERSPQPTTRPPSMKQRARSLPRSNDQKPRRKNSGTVV